MKIVFSRKGFDSKFGGGPSPIVDGRPLSLPIPGAHGETTSYEERGLAHLVGPASRGKLTGASPCHDDPMFADGHCWLGQVGAAQGHLRNQGVGPGDVFLFFGLFETPDTRERHHRIFGAMQVLVAGSPDRIVHSNDWRAPPRPHPHFSGSWHDSNAIWFGRGCTAASASDALRLTIPGENRWSRWQTPQWLSDLRPSYLAGDWRWLGPGTLDARGVWQEAVCDIGDAAEPRKWLEEVLAEIGV